MAKRIVILKPDYHFLVNKSQRTGKRRIDHSAHRSQLLEFTPKQSRRFMHNLKTFKKLAEGDEDTIKNYMDDLRKRCSE